MFPQLSQRRYVLDKNLTILLYLLHSLYYLVFGRLNLLVNVLAMFQQCFSSVLAMFQYEGTFVRKALRNNLERWFLHCFLYGVRTFVRMEYILNTLPSYFVFFVLPRYQICISVLYPYILVYPSQKTPPGTMSEACRMSFIYLFIYL